MGVSHTFGESREQLSLTQNTDIRYRDWKKTSTEREWVIKQGV